jgi:hypothetical protein
MANVTYTELGFPITLVNPPMVTIRGEILPDVSPRDVANAVFLQLIHSHQRLTGDQVRFIRKHMRLRQADLAEVLHMANHSVVSQWESREGESSGMEYNTEVVLRLWMAGKVGQGAGIVDLMERDLRDLRPSDGGPLAVGVARAA